MVRAVAFVPGSPLLVPGLGGQADVLADLRETCLDAVRSLGPGPVVVLGEGPSDAWHDSGTAWSGGWGQQILTGFARRHHVDEAPLDPSYAGTASTRLPPGPAVGTWLAVQAELSVVGVLAVARHETDVRPAATAGSVGRTSVSSRVGGQTALLVVADGSARRGAQAPLPADDRAEAWDDALAAALAAGHLDVDLPLGAELGASAAAWSAAARLTADVTTGRRREATLLHHSAPLGVAYLVATWR